jgi:hypothetical protein
VGLSSRSCAGETACVSAGVAGTHAIADIVSVQHCFQVCERVALLDEMQ